MRIKLNNDKELVAKITEKLKENNGYCPCRIQHTEETKCMCKDFRDKQDVGECHCGLYIKY